MVIRKRRVRRARKKTHLPKGFNAKATFDERLGEAFMAALPAGPGVYRVFDANEALVYVGKAKNLRRRLGQYRNAKRFKKHHKMRKIVADAHRIETEVCATHLAACLLETALIQAHRPKWNVASAFCFLYPFIGVNESGGELRFCFTTRAAPAVDPGAPPDAGAFEWHGAFRSRFFCGEAFFALMRLLAYVGHPVKDTKRREAGTYIFRFRGFPSPSLPQWRAFLTGESLAALEELVLRLVENAGARRKGRAVQDQLNALKLFWRHEARPLRQARLATGYAAYPVAQPERDPLFLRFRLLPETRGAAVIDAVAVAAERVCGP